ncbi:hypothetical protein [Actinomadura decatromicini]|uniref:Uncharacterized protein n=1 Tax=Actinomadura decatromicini TaxID=2604572 RepID=A0A5D3FIJ7_9ACTN|nr:hypothetical protein [Actinomadura decatromicini]TYK48033.1 hypothetical protein FXF68_20330 [Actinomadura decatromicini]
MQRIAKIVVAGTVGSVVAAGGLYAGGLALDNDPAVKAGRVADSSEVASAKGSEQLGGSAAAGRKAGRPCAVNTKVKKGQYVGTYYYKPNRYPWRATGEGPGNKLTYSGESKVTTKATATLGATAEEISAGVSFEVGREESVRITYDVALTKKAFYTIQVNQVFKGWKFHVWQDVGVLAMGTPHSGIGLYCSVEKRNVYKGEAIAYDFWTLLYKCTYRAKGKQRNCSA